MLEKGRLEIFLGNTTLPASMNVKNPTDDYREMVSGSSKIFTSKIDI
jgi:hypothetical protein